MPVKYTQGGEHHDRDDYSFYTRDMGSRDFARTRRFGGDEPEDSRTMSLVSSPLQVPLVGRRSVTPSHRNNPAPSLPAQVKFDNADEEDFEEEIKHMQERRRQSVENRRRLDLKTYDDYDFDEPLEPLVPTYQPRVGRVSRRSNDIRYGSPSPRRSRRQQRPQMDDYDDAYENDDVEITRQHKQSSVRQHMDEPRQPSRQQKRQDDDLQSMLNWRKRSQEPLVHTDFGYAVPPMRKRGDPGMAEEDENIRSVAGYIAKRKQFAVEDDDEMQYYKNPNYQYRYRGIERPLVITDRDVEESMERGKLDKAPMFDMKLRSHVVWEKMNVKFTCTVRGSPTPRVTWYKNMVPLEPSLCSPGKYKISNQFGLHTLEICRASIEDSGTYRVSMQNRKGEISSYATLLVRRYDGGRMGVVDVKYGYNLKKPTDYPDVEGFNIPDKRPHAGAIEVKEYDELPETDAHRQFRSQLENLDFDVKQLIKEAKLDKQIASSDQALTNVVNKDKPTSYTDDITVGAKDLVNDVILNATNQVSEASGTISSAANDYATDDITKTYSTEVNMNSGNPDERKKNGTFKVAIEVNVTNENRRDSLETFEKSLEKEKMAGKEESTEGKTTETTEKSE